MAASRAEQLLEVFETKLPSAYNSSVIRTSQVQMAVDVASFLHPSQRNKNILAVEAPVGTGKSLGALVPALIECSIDRIFSRKRIVYATATINLQGQLMNGEVPLLKELGLLDTALLAKGKSHYYCYLEMKKANFPNDLVKMLTSFYSNGYTGQRDEFENEHGEIANKDWDQVNLKASKRECERCVYSQACPSFQHRNRFLIDENELVITNHEQLIRSAMNRLQENAFPPIVPVNPGIMIIDEAHHFLENFLSQLEDVVTMRDLRAIGKHPRFPRKLKHSYLEIVDGLDKKLQGEAENCETLQGRYPLPPFAPEVLEKLHEYLSDAIEQVFFQKQERVSLNFERDDDFSDKLESIVTTIEHLLDEKRHVSWISYEDLAMTSIPVNFPTRFNELVDYLARQNKIVVMSGTLTTNGQFLNFLNQWRLSQEEVELKVIPDSFQYDKQSLIYVPEDVIDPRTQDEDWIKDQLGHSNELLQLTEGRTLLLSTSKQHMQNMSGPLQEICESLGVSFFRQEQGGVEQLTKQFKSDETSVLLGSGSFFSGFSVPGTALVSVIFSRLPFPVHTDPYLKLIGAGFEDVFMEEIILPHMLVKLNQGVGRLIRDIGDYGIITILDPRVYSARYGEIIRSDLQQKGYRFTRSFAEVQRFYQEKLMHGSEAVYTPYVRSQIIIPEVLKEIGAEVRRNVVEKEKVVRPKKHKITEEQQVFALMICKERGVKLSTKPKFGEDLYTYLVDLYFVKYNSIAPVRDHFPFKNEAQRESVDGYTGQGSRSYQSKKCTDLAFGCTGQCTEHFKQELADRIKQSGGHLSSTYAVTGFCWIMITPYDKNDEIIEICSALTQAAASKHP